NSEAAGRVLDAVQARFAAGAATPVDLASQEAAFDTTRIALSDMEQSEVEARAALAVLLGRVPENFNVTGESLDPLREPAIAPGLPAELLTRRPDVAMAEANLQAASANLTAARAAMLPSLTLTGSGGVQNPALPATILTIGGAGPSFAAAANLTQPIFDHGKLRAQRDETLARERELLAAYRAAVIAALVDVEKALSALEHLRAVEEFQRGNVNESERAFEGARAHGVVCDFPAVRRVPAGAVRAAGAVAGGGEEGGGESDRRSRGCDAQARGDREGGHQDHSCRGQSACARGRRLRSRDHAG